MVVYEKIIIEELGKWEKRMRQKPSLTNRVARSMQQRINKLIPEKVHEAITSAIKQMVRAVLYGAEQTTGIAGEDISFQKREQMILEKIEFYKRTAAAEGGLTGLGGILLGLVELPVLMGIKIKLLFEIAALYGRDINDFRERLYILYIFQLAFSSHHHRRLIFEQMENWEKTISKLPDDIHQFDWRSFQQEYRDYIDLAKMAQLIPVIGAVVGVVVNYRLLNKLGETAMNAYRLRWKKENKFRV